MKFFPINLFFRKPKFALMFFAVVSCLAISVLMLPSYVVHKSVKADDPAPAITLKAQQLVTGLQAPLDMAFAANGDILVAEQTGKNTAG